MCVWLIFIGHHHLKTEEKECKKNYNLFIKPQSTPLLDSLTSSPNENIAKSEMPHHHNFGTLWGEKSTDKKSSYKNNYYKELFSDPLDDESPALKADLKAEKEFRLKPKKNDKKNDLSREELEPVAEPPKNFRSPSFNISGSKEFTNYVFQ